MHFLELGMIYFEILRYFSNGEILGSRVSLGHHWEDPEQTAANCGG